VDDWRAAEDAGEFMALVSRTLVPKFTANLGAEQLVSGWSNAGVQAKEKGYAGAATLYSLTNTAHASIGKDASINQDAAYRTASQDVRVGAHTVAETIIVAGEAKFVLAIPNFDTPAGASTAGGGIAGVSYVETTEASIDSG